MRTKHFILFFTLIILLVPASSRSQLQYKQSGDKILALTWSPNGDVAVTGKINTATTILSPTEYIKDLTDQAGAIVALDWNHAGNLLSSASLDLTINIWDVEPSNILFELAADPINVSSVSWSFDDSILASGGHTGFKLWNPNNGTQTESYATTSPITSLDFHPSDLKLLYTYDNKVVVWDKTTNITVSTFESHTSKVIKASWNNEMSQIISASEDKSIKVWDDSGTEQYSFQHDSSIIDFTLSPDGKLLAATSFSGIFWMWDLVTGEKIFEYDISPIYVPEEGFIGLARKLAWNPIHQNLLALGFDSRTNFAGLHFLDLDADEDSDGESNFEEMKGGTNLFIWDVNSETDTNSQTSESVDSAENDDDADFDRYFVIPIILIVSVRRFRKKKE